RIAVDRHGEAEPRVQAGRVSLHRRVDQRGDVGKLDDRVELAVDLAAREPEQPRPEGDGLASGQLRVKAGAELDQRDDVTGDADRAAGRPGYARDQLQQGRLAGAVAADHAEAGALADLERDVAHGVDRRIDAAARGAVHLSARSSQPVDLRRDQIAKRARSASAITLRHAIELNRRRHQMTSAKYLSIFLNDANAVTNSATVMTPEIATSGHSGARPNTSDARNPSTIALSGLRTNSGRKRADTAASG